MPNKDESIRDTLLDLMGYAMIGIAMHDKRWSDDEQDIKRVTYQENVTSDMLGVFRRGLEQYGTKDLKDISQIAQRMTEKIGRLDNMVHDLVVQVVGDGIVSPQKEGDVGYDLVVQQNTFIPPFGENNGVATIVPVSANIKVPDGYFAEIVGRSSSANKKGILVHTATIDNGYTGQLFACVWNMSNEKKYAEEGERLAQVIFLKAYMPRIKQVEELPKTGRGDTGFGSTGI